MFIIELNPFPFFSLYILRKRADRENNRQTSYDEMSVLIIVVVVSLSCPSFLLLFPLSFSVCLSLLLLTTVCRYSIAYNFYRIALSRCSLCRSRKRALYFRTSNYRNNTHTQCCYATEPVCCCSKKRDARSRTHRRRPTNFQIWHANGERRIGMTRECKA